MSILKRVLGAEPLGEWGVPKLYSIEGRGKAFPLMILIMLVSHQLISDVQCTWAAGEFSCSGSGTSIIVSGTANWDPENPPTDPPPDWGLPTNSVVTNVVGVCTNCSNITPQQLSDLSDILHTTIGQLIANIDNLSQYVPNVLSLIDERKNAISSYQTFQSIGSAAQNAFTNWLCHAGSNDDYWPQAKAVLDAMPNFCTGQAIAANYKASGALSANAIYQYANTFESQSLNQIESEVTKLDQDLSKMERELDYIDTEIYPQLKAGAVICNDGSPPAGSGGGSGSNPTNSVNTEGWCTFDQGTAIISYLGQVSNIIERQSYAISEVTNYIDRIHNTVYKSLFTTYQAIPDWSGLGDTWQRVYLDGAETGWGYEPTNILARIELLLYGISGVGSNTTEFTQSLEDITDSMEQESADVQTSLSQLSTDATAQPAQTFGNALISLFRAMSYEGSYYSGGDIFIPSYEVSIGHDSYYVPSLQLDDQSGVLAGMQRTSRLVFGAIYMFLAAWVIFQYWVWFAGKIASLSRWAVELVSSMFSS